jgi:hypothetical protein
MPIRFRCAYCNQLLGIARRKAGTVVRCPTCAGQVVVPTVETNEPEGQPGEEKQLIFERSDFDELLSQPDSGRRTAEKKPTFLTSSEEPIAITSAVPPPGKTPGEKSDPSSAVQRVMTAPIPHALAEAVPSTAGIFLSRTKVAVLLIVAIVALAAAFAGGMLLDHYVVQPPQTSPAGP